MNRLSRDIRIALRGLRRTPTFAATAVLILGLGIGMAVAMFTVFDAVLLRPLPARDPDGLVVLWGEPTAGVPDAPVALRPAGGPYVERFTVWDDGRVRFVPASDVDWIEADGNYMRLHVGGAQHRVRA